MRASPQSPAMRRYLLRFPLAMAVYAVTLVLCLTWMKQVDPLWSKALLALLPVLPVAYALAEILRMVRSLDELQRQIQTEAVVIAAVVVCMATFAWGLLEKAGLPRMPVVLVLPLFCGCYGIAVWRLALRYHCDAHE
ncbi:MAG: hypothetical protein U1F26_08705 [Lysobacterales bacterium]